MADSTRGCHTWWGRLFCWGCWHRGSHVKDEPFKWHKERKHSPATVYHALATLLSIARLTDQWIFVLVTDFRWWFWQFGTHPDEYWTSQFHAVVKVGGEYAVCLVGELVANMGRSPVSNIASSVGSRLMSPVRARADAREPELSKEDPPKLNEIVEERRRRLGDEHARLYWSGCFTDDTFTPSLGRKRSALIGRDIIECNEEAGVLMADLAKNPVATWGPHIGARYIANAGFGTLTPSKRARALKACHDMGAGALSPKDFERAAGLTGHVIEILALERSLMNGLGHQHRFALEKKLKKVPMASDCWCNLQELIWKITRTGAASFASALRDYSPPPMHTPPPPVIMSSDACTGSHDPVTLTLVDSRGARDPAIFGHAQGHYFRFPLQGAWRQVHITVSEALGPALGILLLGPLIPYSRVILQMDATAAVAFALGKSKARKLQRIYTKWRAIPQVAHFLERCAVQHIAGKANTVDDAGSRGHWSILRAYAAACGVRLERVEVTEEVEAFMAWALEVALEEDDEDAPPAPPPKRHEPSRSHVVGPSSSSPREDEAIVHMVPGTPKRAPSSPRIISPLGAASSPGDRPSPRARTPPRGSPRLISPARPSSMDVDSPGERPPRRLSPSPRPPKRDSPPGSAHAPRQDQHGADRKPPPRLLSPPEPPQPSLIEPVLHAAPSPPPGASRDASRLRPKTAQAVRALASARAAAKLIEDTSPYAMCPNDPAKLRTIVAEVDGRNADAREVSTQQKDNWGWAWWVKACDALDTPYIRPTDSLDETREAYVASFALMFTAAFMKPRSKKDTAAKPQSAWDAYSHSRIMLEEYGCLLPKVSTVRRTLKGTLRNYVRQTFDDEVLVPRRKQPFSRAHEMTIMSTLRNREVPGWSPREHDMMEWEICFTRCVGARKAELCANGKWFSRASLTWFLKGRKLHPTPENIRRADRLQITPVASKSDPFNMNWGGCVMTFNVTPGEHMSVAVAMQRLEATYPVPPNERSGYPLFFDVGALDESDQCPAPVSSSWLTRRFETLLKLAIGPGQAAERSWHSWRVTLACSLRSAVDSEHPDGRGLDVIKLFGRWRSDAAVKLYARLTPDAYAEHVSASLRADAAHLSSEGTGEAMRNVDPIDFIEELDGIASAQETPASSKVPKDKAPPPPSAKPTKKPSTLALAPSGGKARDTATATKPKATVMVPAAVFPAEACGENGGKGWTATSSPHKRGVLRITFTHARDDDGAPFRPVYLKPTCVVPLTSNDEGDQTAPGPPSGAPTAAGAKRTRGERKTRSGGAGPSRPRRL